MIQVAYNLTGAASIKKAVGSNFLEQRHIYGAGARIIHQITAGFEQRCRLQHQIFISSRCLVLLVAGVGGVVVGPVVVAVVAEVVVVVPVVVVVFDPVVPVVVTVTDGVAVVVVVGVEFVVVVVVTAGFT